MDTGRRHHQSLAEKNHYSVLNCIYALKNEFKFNWDTPGEVPRILAGTSETLSMATDCCPSLCLCLALSGGPCPCHGSFCGRVGAVLTSLLGRGCRHATESTPTRSDVSGRSAGKQELCTSPCRPMKASQARQRPTSSRRRFG